MQISSNNIESYISDLLDDQSSDDIDNYPKNIDSAVSAEADMTGHVAPKRIALPDDNKYLSFAVAGSDFLLAANEVISVKSFGNKEAYRDYRLYHVDELLNISRTVESKPPQFVLLLRGELDYAICVDAIHGLVTLPVERLLVRKNVKDRPWYTAISRDFQSALLNSYTLGNSLYHA